MIDAPQLIEWFDYQVKRIDRLLEEKSYYYHACPELYENQLREQRYYYSMTIVELSRLVNNDKHLPKIEAWEVVSEQLCLKVVEHENKFWGTKYGLQGEFDNIIPLSDEQATNFKKALEVENV